MKNRLNKKTANKSFKRACLPVLIAQLMINTFQVQAETQENKSVIEVIKVSANKRSQRMQDVGVSVSAYSGETVKALGLTNTTEITQQIPALQMTAWSPTLTTFNLRGISQNNFSDNLEAPVAVYNDNVYVASMNAVSGQLFDVQRVEVLRGPQGTLFGRNATGGLIHFISRRASDIDFNGYVEASYSEYNKRTLEGAVGGSFSDTARYRFAARTEKSDGYIESTKGPGPLYRLTDGEIGSPNDSTRDLQGLDSYALRGTFQFDLSDDAILDLTVKYSRDNDVATGGYIFLDTAGDPETGLGLDINYDSPLTGKPFEHANNRRGYFERKVLSTTAELMWYLDNGIQLNSITNYTTMDKDYFEDGDGLDVDGINFRNNVKPFTQFSQELRFSRDEDLFRWQAGVYILDMDLDLHSITSGSGVFDDGNPDTNDGASGQNLFVKQESKNWSVFAQLEFDLTDDLLLTTGLRWSQDDKKFDLTTEYFNATLTPEQLAANTELFGGNITDLKATLNAEPGLDESYSEIDYGDYAARIQLDYKLSSETLLFASYNRGIKGGNWSPNKNVAPGTVFLRDLRHDEETLHSYEVGFKTAFWDNKARLNASTYYYDYEDYQSFSFIDFGPSVANKDASSKGGEIELFLAPGNSWDFIFGLAVIDSDVSDVNTAIAGVTRDAEFVSAPNYSFNFLIRKAFEVGGNELALQLDGVAYGEQYLESHNSRASKEGAYAVLNASVTYTMDDWRVSAWVKNLTDEEYRVYNLDFGAEGSTAMFAPPQWFGVTASYQW